MGMPVIVQSYQPRVERENLPFDRNSVRLHLSIPEEAEEEIQVPATPEQQSPPPSTAPARLADEGGEGRGKRKRKMTEAYRQARQEGLL
jgi:hypothetical protein